MATRFYLPSTGSPPVSPSVNSGWEYTFDSYGTGFDRKPATLTRGTTAMTSINSGTMSPLSAFEVCGHQWVYGPIGAVTISGNVTWRVRGRAGTYVDIWRSAGSVWVAKPDLTVRGTMFAAAELYPNATDDWGTTFANHTSTKSITSVSAQDGDYLVMEIGAKHDASGSTDEVYLEIGDTNSSNYMYVEFTETIGYWAPAGLSYTSMTTRTKKNKAITTNSPSSTGGPIASYAVQTGSLPTGLSLNSSTGDITGTPTASGTYTFTIRGTNEGGTTDSATMTYIVWSANSVNLKTLMTGDISIG